MTDRDPCPQCGAKDTIEALQDELDAVIRRAREVAEKSAQAPVTIGGSVFFSLTGWQEPARLRFVYEICAECGITYDPTARSRAAAVRNQIAEVMKRIPLDLLGDVDQGAQNEPAGA